MQKNILITGTSKGLGMAFAENLLEQGHKVIGCSRTQAAISHPNYRHHEVDLQNALSIEAWLSDIAQEISRFELVILNAGLLGTIKTMNETTQTEIDQVMDVNVWANKHLLDNFLSQQIPVKQVVMISSGAAVKGSKGWGAYALSKSTLNMLCQLYAAEMPDTQFLSLAPGLIDTQMQSYLTDPNNIDTSKFPSIRRLQAAKGTNDMPVASDAAQQILNALPDLFARFDSGDFVDIRSV